MASRTRMPSHVARWALRVACAGAARVVCWTAATSPILRDVTRERQRQLNRSVCTERLDDDLAARARTVELDQEDALPGTEQQLAIGERGRLAGPEHELQAVRVAGGALVGLPGHGAGRGIL